MVRSLNKNDKTRGEHRGFWLQAWSPAASGR